VGKGPGGTSGPPVTQAPRKPLLVIPSEAEGSSDFIDRLAALIRAHDTQIYVDTSFLMWMTKIGSSSRQELVGWLLTNCPTRVHVPIWAAHEYLKHYVAGTIVTELAERTSELAYVVGRTYTYFRPFIDEPLGEGAEDPSTIRAATRTALNSLDRLAAISQQWHKRYQKHASEVIAFINENTPETTSLYGHLEVITQEGSGRFVGSVPPGYRDRHKNGGAPRRKEMSEEAPTDSNRYGDLVFWKELLDHAKRLQAKTLIVLTNDRKNDWHMGRGDVANIDPALLALKKSWRPVPRAHPMLVMEARLAAGVEQVELLDSAYLAALLRKLSEDSVRAFADVAIIPDGPEPEKESDRRTKIYEARLAEDAANASTQAAEKGYLFSDSPQILNTRTSLLRALYDSRRTTEERSATLIEQWRASVEAKRPLTETITAETLEGFDHKELVRLARELHDKVLQGIPGYEEAVADIVSTLDRLPPNTAACLYLGLLASMYLVRETNASRIPPSSPVARDLFARQSAEYALNGLKAIAKRLLDNDSAPLYIPSGDCPPVIIDLDTEPDTAATDQLRSIRVQGVELLAEAQADDALRLSKLFDSHNLTDGRALVRKACELFAIPIDQVKLGESFDLNYALTETIGFKRPVDISIPKERLLRE
jgi:PIN like domain